MKEFVRSPAGIAVGKRRIFRTAPCRGEHKRMEKLSAFPYRRLANARLHVRRYDRSAIPLRSWDPGFLQFVAPIGAGCLPPIMGLSFSDRRSAACLLSCCCCLFPLRPWVRCIHRARSIRNHIRPAPQEETSRSTKTLIRSWSTSLLLPAFGSNTFPARSRNTLSSR